MSLLVMLTIHTSNAQVNVSVNIGSQPLWGPENYDYVEYYYLPEAEAYYYVPTNQFIYLNSGNWVYARTLPSSYHVDLYRTYKVIVNEPKPYKNHHKFVKNYGKYKHAHSPHNAIRDSRNTKYYVVKGHPGNSKHNANQPRQSKPIASGNQKGNQQHSKPQGGNGNGHGNKHK